MPKVSRKKVFFLLCQRNIFDKNERKVILYIAYDVSRNHVKNNTKTAKFQTPTTSASNHLLFYFALEIKKKHFLGGKGT